MSREKLLWSVSGALAVLVIVLSIMLFMELHDPGTVAPTEPPPPIASEPGSNTDPGAVSERKIAQAGNVTLGQEEYVSGLQEKYGNEYVKYWLKRTVVQLEAQALGVNISRSDIDAEMARMQVGYESPEEYFRVMREQLGLTEEALRNDALYRLMLEGIATFHIEVTDADVERYIEEHPEEFEPIQEIRYAQIVSESREMSMRALEELGKGVDFGLLAKDVSIDSATAPDGGDSGWVSSDDPFIDKQILDALSGMEVGDVSAPIPLDDQWAIVTLLGRRTIDPLDDSSVKQELKRELALTQAPSLFDVEQYLLKKYNAVDFLDAD